LWARSRMEDLECAMNLRTSRLVSMETAMLLLDMNLGTQHREGRAVT
jgi:hypothetical protein